MNGGYRRIVYIISHWYDSKWTDGVELALEKMSAGARKVVESS